MAARGTDVLAVIRTIFPAPMEVSNRRGRWIFSLKDGDDAVLRRALALPVAPPSGLEDGVQTGQLPIDGWEIHIDTGLDERGGETTRQGQPIRRRRRISSRILFAVRGVHQGGEMEIA